jgi:hypothetical protein
MQELQKFYSKDECRYFTHDFHPYPHKLVPQIAKVLIEKYSEAGDTILDCCCGSGTAGVEARVLGRNALGIDSNPLACLLAKVKTTKINHLEDSVKVVMDEVHNHLTRNGTLQDYTERIQPKFPEFKYRDTWFCKDALLGLSVIKQLISTIENQDFFNFCLVAFSCLVKEFSNATSFYRLTKAKRPRHVALVRISHTFNCKLREMARKLKQLPENACSVNIFQTDARFVDIGKVDFALLNVPKYNIDFERCFKIYSWWLNFDVKEVNQQMIGTMKRKQEYYRDIKLVLRNVYGALQEGKYFAILVTDSYDKGKHLKHGDMIKNIALEIGFRLHEKFVRTIPKRVLPFATRDRMEDILIFKKTITFK